MTIDSPNAELCTLIGLDTVANFNSVSGDYTLSSQNIALVPEGTYSFIITATVGVPGLSKEVQIPFTAIITSPCPTTPLNIVEPDPFPDLTNHYIEDSVL